MYNFIIYTKFIFHGILSTEGNDFKKMGASVGR